MSTAGFNRVQLGQVKTNGDCILQYFPPDPVSLLQSLGQNSCHRPDPRPPSPADTKPEELTDFSLLADWMNETSSRVRQGIVIYATHGTEFLHASWIGKKVTTQFLKPENIHVKKIQAPIVPVKEISAWLTSVRTCAGVDGCLLQHVCTQNGYLYMLLLSLLPPSTYDKGIQQL